MLLGMNYIRSWPASTLGALALGLSLGTALIAQAAPKISDDYNPTIDPADFSTTIDNPYFSLTPGEELIYEGEAEEGTERDVIQVPGDTEIVMGVTTLVQEDRSSIDGVLVEDTRDYFAQDSAGNVWYFGEDVNNYEDGVLVDHEGSWHAGVDGAQPGIIMEAHPKPGDTYRQEFAPGIAEDMGKVISLRQKVSVPYGDFRNCLRTRDTTPLERGVVEYKYYCTDAGNTVLEINRTTGERLELVEVNGI